MIPLSLHPDRLFSSDPAQRDFSRELYATIKQLPIVSPHGHTDPQWYADNKPFTNASALLITPITFSGCSTARASSGLGSGKPTYHGLLVASIDLVPIALHTNIGYARNRADPTERRHLYHVSAAAVWTLDPTWRLLLAELAGDTNVDNTRSVWPSVARVGAIYTVKKGFDIDIGYQTRLNHEAASQTLLIGLTARWGP